MASSRFLIFDGPNSDLWVSDGTAAGTKDLGAIANGSAFGFNPQYLTEFNNQILFNGTDANNEFGLWVTDGTAAGTHELTGISGANPAGLDPRYMAVFGNDVLFRGAAGVAGDYVPGLWITNGTAAGTFEIGGVANIGINDVSPGGLLPSDPDFTVLNGVALFSGRDAANNQGLWVTNGTAAGTFELAPIPGAFAVGSPGSDVLGSGPNMAVLGNVVLFNGTDLQDTPGSLWETNGTAAGTFEIGGQGNAGIVGSPNGFTGQFTSELPLGIQPNDLTTLNGQVLFAGFDNTLKPNGFYEDTDALWVSDGTAAGTVEVGGAGNAGISGANPASQGGIFWNGSIEFPDFTPYNGKALFVGYDSSNHVSLWETDGTAIGTSEIGGLGNAGIANISLGGLVSDSLSPEFTVFNGEVYFRGFDASGQSGLWVTDGTAAGTHEVIETGSNSPIDLTMAALSLSNEDLVSEVYIGYYNRSPDPTGMQFWLNALAGGETLTQVANQFANSSESTAIYPFLSNPNLANASNFVTQVYSNLLNRAPDNPGLQFWSQELQSGAVTPGGFILAIEQSVNQQTSTADAMTLGDKLTVAVDYVTRISAAGVPFSETSAHGSLAPVTSDPSTIATGEAVTTAYIGMTTHVSSGLGLLT
jgi:ELWxxDGT repeat protein